MSVSGIPAGGGLDAVTWQSNIKERQQDLQNLATALRSGDLQKAQQSFSALQQLRQNVQAAVGSANPNDPLASDWSAIGKALKSGNLDEARAAFNKLQQDVKAIHQGRHHHHHAPGVQPSSEVETTTGSSGNPTSLGNGQVTGTLLDVSA